MDTQTATNDVPNFKLAKVGKDRDRKRGGAGWFNGANGTGGLGGLGGAGAESSGGMAALFSGASLAKVATVLLVSGLLSAGAWQFGRMFSATSAPTAGKLFADRGAQKYANTSDVVKGDNSIPNSLGYVSGSLDGMTPEERAKKAAADEAARKAAEDAAKKQAAEDAAKAAASDKAPTDATAGAAVGGSGSGSGMNSNPFSSRFGGLSNGLSGGAGLSGGIGQGFGGMGMGGGVGKKGVDGSMSAMKAPAAASTSRAAAHPMSPLSGKNLAFGQLKQTSSASRTAAGTSGEGSATTASQPFDGGANSGGTSIDGPGVGAGATTGSGVGGTNTSGGAPVGGSTTSCADGQATDASGNCVATSTPAASNATEYQSLLTMAEGLIGIAVILGTLGMLAKHIPTYGTIIAEVLFGIVAVIGLAIAAIGATIAMKYGDMETGGIVGVVGVAIAALGAYGLYSEANPAAVAPAAAAPGAAAGAAGVSGSTAMGGPLLLA